MARFNVLRPNYDEPRDCDCAADIITVEDVERMEVFRSGALGFITKAGRLVRAIAPGAWDEAWEVNEAADSAAVSSS